MKNENMDEMIVQKKWDLMDMVLVQENGYLERLWEAPRSIGSEKLPKGSGDQTSGFQIFWVQAWSPTSQGGRDKYSVTVRGHLFLAPFAPGWSYFDPFFIPQLEEISAWREMNLEGPGRGEGGFGAYLDFRRTTNPEGFWVFWGFLLGGWGDLTRGWGGFGVRTRRLSAR